MLVGRVLVVSRDWRGSGIGVLQSVDGEWGRWWCRDWRWIGVVAGVGEREKKRERGMVMFHRV